ncbi:hypothetical protein ACFO4P_12440 [Epilithonimonas pallida]|uniref:Uncharacterized protein n=1 Tax=Epilithonimonas pallida TaxID=373671 RepID=A0ABY1R6X8_9FLAO|nr:hypothetical protein [Epilithonimonas pallida]SMP95315.1 hypothetical protein SAMN05421679_10727 [Epilithonimonas pallida]
MIPQTEIELENWMKNNCYNFNSYSINGNFIWEGFGIEKDGSLFHWYYTERGEKNILETFRTEQEIIEFVYNQLKTDKWAKTHCIGFGFDKNEVEQLVKILNEMNVEYFQDQIPYYTDKSTYRTFVLGCDILKVENLKTKYYNPPQ